MRQAMKNIYGVSVMVLLIFSGQTSIAGEDNSSANNPSVSEGNEIKIVYGQSCSPMPECARDNSMSQPEDQNWLQKILDQEVMKIIYGSKKSTDNDNS